MKKTRIKIKKIIIYISICAHTMSGCVATSGQRATLKVGPPPSSSHNASEPALPVHGIRLDVIIPVFDPGLSEKAENYEEEGIWPELRRAEANRFAYKLKLAMDSTNKFGAVRVTPDKTASGDLYILGKIKESNGLSVAIDIQVIDASGREWLDKEFKHKSSEAFYKNPRRAKNQDPYQPVFDNTASTIANLLKKRSPQELNEIKYIAKLLFGASLTEDAFMQHIEIQNGRVNLISKPSDNEPIIKRTDAVRIKEQLLVDDMQANYAGFSAKMLDSYLKWQEASATEQVSQSEAKKKALWQAIGGTLLLGLSVAGAVAAKDNRNDSINLAVAGTGIAGAWMLSKSFKTREEAILHRDVLNELGETINLELSDQVVKFEDQTIELTGDAKQQFAQWREFLHKIYQQESTPDVILQ